MSYTIAGRQILNEYIALAVLGGYGAIAASQMGGSKDAKASAAGASPDAKAANDPPINASSSDEEAFIKQFLAEAEGKSDRLV
ncbi:uncharacterized protein UMAG_10479 [Mycosarcoma maydis]|uniref:ATP synthase subunit K, mitochondrial n=1 Tax=Mycosarcoma maydis TaxID=5270 RepID=A0A0D1E022_MYCMD|nr:uncharacterized protein UMAG_10479 [Ustilago maydis 521]KIS68090.1 hypothetical protein UMAG_10479 [Ustilago maydis 521]|eukprot:XP_011390303.1 hypothetical protein UMAG_10479 [Ustilago maydis 521]